ncbi:MAG: hypothetical protein IPJ78_02420 [Gemmatimonadetes bacterium]|jgi:hypothetical protein|nr:hypothetical protein [Gemmatimonadota bacterium]
MKIGRLFGHVASATMLATFVGCTDQPLTAPRVSASEVLVSVTEDVATQVDASGHFRFAPPPAAEVPQISESRARELASAYWTTFGSGLRSAREKQRGAGIARTLTVCPRVYLAESAYEPMAPDVPREYRRGFGAQWLVGLCSGSEQQLAIAVSVEAADLTIDSKGVLIGARAGDFRSASVVPGAVLPVSPEVGAVQAARQFGERVAGVPTLRRLGHRFSAFTSVWVFPVERPVVARGRDSGTSRQSGSLAFGINGGMRDPSVLLGNPDFVDESRAEPQLVWTENGSREIILMRRVDVPIRWEAVSRGQY